MQSKSSYGDSYFSLTNESIRCSIGVPYHGPRIYLWMPQMKKNIHQLKLLLTTSGYAAILRDVLAVVVNKTPWSFHSSAWIPAIIMTTMQFRIPFRENMVLCVVPSFTLCRRLCHIQCSAIIITSLQKAVVIYDKNQTI